MKKKLKKLIKKASGLIIAFCLLLQNFAFMMPVYALEDPEITITGVKPFMGSENLEYDDGMYVLDTADSIDIEYKLTNYDANQNYYVGVKDLDNFVDSYNVFSVYDPEDMSYTKFLSFNHPVEEFEFALCTDWGCEEILYETTVSVKINKYEEMNAMDIYATKIMQGGKEITTPGKLYDWDNTLYFIVNPLQDVIITLKGESLIADASYDVGTSSFLGSELMEGIDYHFKYDENNNEFLRWSYGGTITKYMMYKANGNEYELNLHFQDAATLPNYEETLKYTNYDNQIKTIELEHDKIVNIIDNKYHNATNSLTYKIDGRNFEDTNYDVNVTVKKDGSVYYTKNEEVNGLLLNDGYDLELTSLSLSRNESSTYEFNIEIYDIRHTKDYMYAAETLTINSVTQNDQKLTITKGVYQATGFKNIYLDLYYANHNQNDNSKVIRIVDSSDQTVRNSTYNVEDKYAINPNFSKQTESFNILLCQTYECTKIYAIESIEINLTRYNEMVDASFTISNLRKGGELVPLDGSSTFNFNYNQDITFDVKGENLIDDAIYTVQTNTVREKHYYLGSELEKGVTVTYYPLMDDNYFSIKFYLEDINYRDYYYFDGENTIQNYHPWPFYYSQSNELPERFWFSLKYTNNPSILVEQSTIDFEPYYIVNSKYHNTNNSLSYSITGSNFENKDYDINIKVTKDDEIIYNNNYTRNGLLINNGLDIELSDLVLTYANDYVDNTYKMYLTIDNATRIMDVIYKPSVREPEIRGSIYQDYSNREHTDVTRTFPNTKIYDLNLNIFNRNARYELYYQFDDLEEDVTYDYTIECGRFIDGVNGDDYTITSWSTIHTGSKTGSELEYGTQSFEATNANNYDARAYRLTIKKDGEIVAYSIIVINFVNKPILFNVSMSSGGTTFHVRQYDRKYIGSFSKDINIKLEGNSFVSNETYRFNLCDSPYKLISADEKDYYTINHCQEYIFTGETLNEGRAIINYSVPTNMIIDGIDFKFDTHDYGSYTPADKYDIYDGRLFEIAYVEASEILDDIEETGYTINDEENYIKNIIKNTTVAELINNIESNSTKTVKVFEKDGEEEADSKVGTGMILRVYDAEENALMDIEIVVKGDITGDGNISITDLVKVKLHLVEVDELEGIYAAAADVTDTGDVSLTDLINMSRDVAGIEVID